MEYSINLDTQLEINIETLKRMPYLTHIYFTLTVDSNLQEKLAKISQLVEYLSEHPTISTGLKVLSIKSNPLKEYRVVTVGGTFDRLHIGHQILLLYAALSATQTIHIGITADQLLAHKKYSEVIQHIAVRMHNVVEFIRAINPTVQLVAYQLNDSFGTTTTQKRIQCIVFSPQPGDNLIEINIERVRNGYNELEVLRCPLLTPIQKYDEKFSSTYIRRELLEKNRMSTEEMKQQRQHYDTLIEKLSKIKGETKINNKIAQLWWDHIYFAYSQRWRYYHTNRHIYQLLNQWNSPIYQQQKESLTLEQITSLELALLFHDIVYCPESNNNKKESEDVCENFVKEYLGDSPQQKNLIAEAKRLIRQTENHRQPKCVLSQIIYDLDMGVLNNPTQFKTYAEEIRKEYQPCFGQQFPKKRLQFLSQALKEGLHYSFTAEYVQANLKWEMESLQYRRR